MQCASPPIFYLEILLGCFTMHATILFSPLLPSTQRNVILYTDTHEWIVHTNGCVFANVSSLSNSRNSKLQFTDTIHWWWYRDYKVDAVHVAWIIFWVNECCRRYCVVPIDRKSTPASLSIVFINWRIFANCYHFPLSCTFNLNQKKIQKFNIKFAIHYRS